MLMMLWVAIVSVLMAGKKVHFMTEFLILRMTFEPGIANLRIISLWNDIGYILLLIVVTGIGA